MPIRIETISQQTSDLCFSQAMERAKELLSVGVPVEMKWIVSANHLNVHVVPSKWELADDAALAKGLELSAASVGFMMTRIGQTKDEIIAVKDALIADLEAMNARQERRLRSLMKPVPKPTKPTKKR